MKIKLIILTLFIAFPLIYFFPFKKQNSLQIDNLNNKNQCLKEFKCTINPVSKNDIKEILNSNKNKITIDINVKNTSYEPFFNHNSKGGVNISYRWLDRHTKEPIMDGFRTKLKSTLFPYKEIKTSLVIKFPRKKGEYILRLSPVQIECPWFYEVNPNSSYDIEYKIK